MVMSIKDMFYSEGTTFSNAEDRAFAREELIYNVTEDINVILEELRVTKNELAKKLGKSRSHITQLLSGSRNMTFGTFSDICFVLKIKPEINFPGINLESTEYEPEIDWKLFIEEFEVPDKEAKVIRSKNIIDRSAPELWSKAA
jgi:transcriptional regulator with XRE-family HTH domain